LKHRRFRIDDLILFDDTYYLHPSQRSLGLGVQNYVDLSSLEVNATKPI